MELPFVTALSIVFGFAMLVAALLALVLVLVLQEVVFANSWRLVLVLAATFLATNRCNELLRSRPGLTLPLHPGSLL